ncbi:nucleocapsid protein [Coredo virus]|uniref:Nucleocapsid protein n=1 Tax=Coredo virus TaxID=2689366 RepID=A0A6B9KLN2_9VIRU|nr:nucleocapsid protein [Coredo virus]QHA33846.1 nucleocapsid protein [Coredo virus]
MENAKAFKVMGDLELETYVHPDDLKRITEDIETQPKTAAELCGSTVAIDMIAQFVDPEILAKEIAGTRLDVPSLICEAAKVCPDILDELKWKNRYHCLDLMRRILYMIGPETRSVKPGRDNDKNWRIRVPAKVTPEYMNSINNFDFATIGYADISPDLRDVENAKLAVELTESLSKFKDITGTGHATANMFVISTYKNSTAPVAQPKLKGGVLLLTIKQATIIGLYILSKFTKLANEKDYTILTPLAGAIFPRASLAKMMEDEVISSHFGDTWELMDCINKSAQNGGQFLVGSRADVAAVCALVGTQSITKEEERRKICHRTVKQFLNHERPADKELFKAIARYATGGIPDEWTFDVLVNDLKDVKMTMDMERKAAARAQIRLNSQA